MLERAMLVVPCPAQASSLAVSSRERAAVGNGWIPPLNGRTQVGFTRIGAQVLRYARAREDVHGVYRARSGHQSAAHWVAHNAVQADGEYALMPPVARHLVTIAICDYDDPSHRLQGVREAADRVTRAFARVGYEYVLDLSNAATREQLFDSLHSHLQQPAEGPALLVLYVIAHGVAATESGRAHVLLMKNHGHASPQNTEVGAAELVRAIAAEPRRYQGVLLILDSCFAAAAASDVIEAVEGSGFGRTGQEFLHLIATARAVDEASVGAFSEALGTEVSEIFAQPDAFRTLGPDLPMQDLLRRIDQRIQGGPSEWGPLQAIRYSTTGAVPAAGWGFIPNPHHDAQPLGPGASVYKSLNASARAGNALGVSMPRRPRVWRTRAVWFSAAPLALVLLLFAGWQVRKRGQEKQAQAGEAAQHPPQGKESDRDVQPEPSGQEQAHLNKEVVDSGTLEHAPERKPNLTGGPTRPSNKAPNATPKLELSSRVNVTQEAVLPRTTTPAPVSEAEVMALRRVDERIADLERRRRTECAVLQYPDDQTQCLSKFDAAIHQNQELRRALDTPASH